MEIFIEGEVLASDTPRTWKLTCAGGRTGITEVVSFDDLTVVPMVVKPNGCITIPDPDMVEEVPEHSPRQEAGRRRLLGGRLGHRQRQPEVPADLHQLIIR